MNRHAEKLHQDVDGPDASNVDDDLNRGADLKVRSYDGITEEVYACPRCGLTISRR